MKKLFLIIASIILTCNLAFGQVVNLNAGESATVNCTGDHVTVTQPTTLQTVINCVPVTPPPTEFNIVVNHNSIDLFDRIPASYLASAGAKKLLMRHASVGQNISDGLGCIVNNSPNYCRTGFAVPANSIPVITQPQYNRSNWVFEFRGNPGWYGKVQDFINNFNSRQSSFDFVSWKNSYVDDSTIYRFWLDTTQPDIFNVEALSPQNKVLFWTAAISKLPLQYIEDFNAQMRNYTAVSHKPLIDIADIESHRPDGTQCITNGVPTICSEYCVETQGGHLTNGMSEIRVAKAVWVMMAQLAGWNPQQ